MSSQYRKQRRHKARNKAYKPKEVRMPSIAAMAGKTQLAMAPLDRIIAQIERDGTATVDSKGIPVFQASDGEWYPSGEAIAGLIWHFEMWGTRQGKTPPLEGLRELAIALHYLVPIQQSTLDKLRIELPELRRISIHMSEAEASDLVMQTQIRAELEAAQGA